MSANWKPIETLPDFPDCPDMILVWNSCNGTHLIWMAMEMPFKVRERGVWQLWRTCPEPSEALKSRIVETVE